LNKETDRVDDLPFKWFEGALLNYAENLLKYDDENIAIHSYGEAFTEIRSISYKDLKKRVKLYQSALRKCGVKKGDFVAGNNKKIFQFRIHLRDLFANTLFL
jgi:acetoacetyl-CoA synthetase